MSRDIPSWVLIVNPASANGRTGRYWSRNEPLLRSILPPFEAWLTTHPGHARELAEKAADRGAAVIAVHGGDGTVNEVVNGLLHSPSVPGALALLPNGTGADLVRTLGIPHSLALAARQAGQAVRHFIDIGEVHFKDMEGRPSRRYFLNVTDVGFGGEVVRYVNNHSKILGGKLSFFQGLLVTLLRFQNKTIRLTLDDGEPQELRASSIVVANGQYFGGGMWVAPEAEITDGCFEVVVIGDVSKREVLGNTSRLYHGTLSGHPKVRLHKVRTLELDSEEEVLIDLDGELVGRLPARFQILPRKLAVLY